MYLTGQCYERVYSCAQVLYCSAVVFPSYCITVPSVASLKVMLPPYRVTVQYSTVQEDGRVQASEGKKSRIEYSAVHIFNSKDLRYHFDGGIPCVLWNSANVPGYFTGLRIHKGTWYPHTSELIKGYFS